MAVKENEGERKQTKDNGVFLRFGDDGAAMKAKLYRALTMGRKSRYRTAATSRIIESDDSIGGSRLKVAERLVQQSRSAPRRRSAALISEGTAAHPNAQIIPEINPDAGPIHIQVGDGSAAACEGDGGRVGGAGGKSDVGSAAAGNSGIHRSDVFVVGAGKQGRKRDVLIAGFSAGVEVAVVVQNSPSIAAAVVGVAGGGVADAPKLVGGGRAAKHPERLVGVVLALVDVDVQLRVRYPPPPPQMQATAANKDKLRFLLICCFINTSQKFLCF